MVIYNKKNISRKTIVRKTHQATRGSLKPQWNIIPDGTITKNSPHTITLEKKPRENSDLAVVTQTLPTPPERNTNNKPRLIHMVA